MFPIRKKTKSESWRIYNGAGTVQEVCPCSCSILWQSPTLWLVPLNVWKFSHSIFYAIATSNCVPWIYWMCVPIYRWIRGWQRMWTCGLPWVMGSSIGKSQIVLHTIVNQRINSSPMKWIQRYIFIYLYRALVILLWECLKFYNAQLLYLCHSQCHQSRVCERWTVNNICRVDSMPLTKSDAKLVTNILLQW